MGFKKKLFFIIFSFFLIGLAIAQDAVSAGKNIELAKTALAAKKYDDAISLLHKSIDNLKVHTYLLEYGQIQPGRTKSVDLKGELHITWSVSWVKSDYEGYVYLSFIKSDTKDEETLTKIETTKEAGSSSGETYFDADGKYYLEIDSSYVKFTKLSVKVE